MPAWPGPPLRALTVREPWGGLIAEGWKDVENRKWKPPLGNPPQPTWFAIHTSKTFDSGVLGQIAQQIMGQGKIDTFRMSITTSHILGAMLVDGWTEQSDSPWFVGPIGWRIRACVQLVQPIPYDKGSLVIWPLPPLIYGEMHDSWEIAAEHRVWEDP